MLKNKVKKILVVCIPIMLIGTSTSLNGVTTYAAKATSTASVATVTATIYTDNQGVKYNLDNTNKTASVSGVNSNLIQI